MDRFFDENPAESREDRFGDEALMRDLARRYPPRGAAALGLARGVPRRLEALLAQARRLRRVERVDDEALARLEGQDGLALACARRACRDGGMKLVAWAGRPRVEVALERLCAGGEAALDLPRLLSALEALDAAQPLTQAELWAVPEALRVVLSRAEAATVRMVVDRARRCARAARWVHQPLGPLAWDDPVFVEYALKRAGEEGLPEARGRLDAGLARRGLSASLSVAEAQAARARLLMRLDNLQAARRMLEALDWEACFARVSALERALRGDPAGVYARMDDASRAAVREQVARIARRAGLPEVSVARCAVEAARNEEGLRGGVCWWLYDDEGRRALLDRLGRPEARLRRIVPDPKGRRTVAALLGLSALLTAAFACCAGHPWLWALCVPLGWTAASGMVSRFYPRFFHPARLLRLELKEVPEDCRTLVTVPALLSSPERVEAVCDQLEALGCLERGANIDCLLLGDLSDAREKDMPADADILARARTRIAAMNAAAGREKYALLVRARERLEPDGMWMGKDRKRGALMALNRLLLGREGAVDAFALEGAACERLRQRRYRYVITLDADTRALPSDLRRLIGAMAHPLNRPEGDRGFALLQPRMETLPSACVNGFVELFAGAGGVSAYPVSVSNLWQDLTGRGIYGGKGIYDVRAFGERLEGALPEGRILSHDLIEGAVAGAGFVGDVALYDGYPRTWTAAAARLHRWTRGDWQLLPLLLAPGPLPNGRRIGLADRYRMLDNLIRSLRAPALLALLLGAVWTGSEGALLAALIAAAFEALLGLGNGDALKWRRAVAELAALPLLARNALDAALRTLWRLCASGRHLMEWVTAADAEARPGRVPRWPSRAAALLALPGLLNPGWLPVALSLAGLFLMGPGWLESMAAEPTDPPEALSPEDAAAFLDLARDTWRFFEDCVPEGGEGLPPDNLQLDPPVGLARRTSPTNIALYLLSCLAARRLGFIDAPELHRRHAQTLNALKRLEKWRGNLYNWYDIDTLAPLTPRYVSSVDGGNLAAVLLLCANAPETAPESARRMEALARGMELEALYDAGRRLFHIGVDARTGRPSAGHYDLLASESRILSYAAMMLGRVQEAHWQRLGRPCARVGERAVPLSWSGTLFEYLMPELFLAAPPRSLLGEGVQGAVEAQLAWGRHRGRPWGVSESGYAALDAALNYQYRAFGLRALALDGSAEDGVVAPYAAALAAMRVPGASARNLAEMTRRGWRGEYGLYEAADYLHGDADGNPALVKSHMAHHQGMALCALCNALTGDSLRADFINRPEARALSLLLEERACPAPKARSRASRAREDAPVPSPRLARQARAEGLAPETQLLAGDGATALCTADGAALYRRGGIDALRFSGTLRGRRDPARVHLTDLDSGLSLALGDAGSRAWFEPGIARIETRLNGLQAALVTALSPEDGTLLRVVELRNAGERPARCAVTHVAPVALAAPADWQAHAAFQSLFVECARFDGDGMLLRRRPGSRGAGGPALAHLVAGPGRHSGQTDYDALAGRMSRAEHLPSPLMGAERATLNPVSALQTALELAPGQTARVSFALSLLDGENGNYEGWLARWRQPEQCDRALRLASARARSMLGFIGLDGAGEAALQRMAALLADGSLASRARSPRRGEQGASKRGLWPLGLSGDRPLLVMDALGPGDAGAVREMIRAHGFYRAMGVEADLVLVDRGEGGYERPVRDMLEGLISASHLNALRNAPGGVWLIDWERLDGEARRALRRGAWATFSSARDFYAQARALTAPLLEPMPAAPREMTIGSSALPEMTRVCDNGLGGFAPEGGYVVDVGPESLPPAPWCNLLADGSGGLLLSERGGGFFWHGNSREGRLTPWGNDSMREGFGLTLSLIDPQRGEVLSLLPGERPQTAFRAFYSAAETAYSFDNRRAAGSTRFALDGNGNALIDMELESRSLRGEGLWLAASMDWLMGADRRDAVYLNGWFQDGACLVTGAMPGVGWLAATDALAQPLPEAVDFSRAGEGRALGVPLRLHRGERRALRLALGWAGDVEGALAAVRALREGVIEPRREDLPRLSFETPDAGLNHLANDFLLHQVLASRVLGRTGLYQPGGAWGFRDQLQDMLALLQDEPDRVREHLLRCAARQFGAGDVLHWWHEPCFGVRTRISDDALFLPFVAAAYVKRTGDAAILEETVAYLEDVEIPEGREDVCAAMSPGGEAGTLHDHCMRAFRRTARLGSHGLALMGAGDWNDGMNRVGAEGRGESVWLSEFLIACADDYRQIAPVAEDRAWLEALAGKLRGSVERFGWDGSWYLRAWTDEGAPLGGAACDECRIDALPQAWAVLAGLDPERCRRALDAAWAALSDREAGLIRLLTPPFEGRGADPGYIRGYPPGVRENGGQYTHGALWLLMAFIRAGDGARAHEALRMLLPFNHADTPEKARVYRVEPYVMAADVYDHPDMRGRGGWTWYTGSAAWMYNGLLALLGYERRGDAVRLNALLGDWPAAGVTVPFGGSRYRLICEKTAARVTLDGVDMEDDFIRMVDDGREHVARFPGK